MSKFVEVSVTEYFSKKMLNLNPSGLTTQFKVINWIKKEYFPKLSLMRDKMAKTLESTGLKNRLAEFVVLEKKWSMIDSHWSKLNRFLSLYSKDNWVMNILDTPRGSKFEFKPIDVAPFTEEYLFKSGKKVLMMSATIVNKEAFCEVLGIPKEQCAFVSMPSPFPIENRPVFTQGIGSMSDQEKKDFFNKIDKKYKGKNEETGNKALTGSPKSKVDLKPKVDYNK